MSAKVNAAHSLRRTIEDAERKLEQLALIPTDDDFADRTAIRVTVRRKYGNEAHLVYLFLKIVAPVSTRDGAPSEVRWYFTGKLFGRGTGALTRDAGWCRWDQLVSWLIHETEIISWEELEPRLKVAPGWVPPETPHFDDTMRQS